MVQRTFWPNKITVKKMEKKKNLYHFQVKNSPMIDIKVKTFLKIKYI